MQVPSSVRSPIPRSELIGHHSPYWIIRVRLHPIIAGFWGPQAESRLETVTLGIYNQRGRILILPRACQSMRSCLTTPQTSGTLVKVINTRYSWQLHVWANTGPVSLRRRRHGGEGRQFGHRRDYHSRSHFRNFTLTLHVYQFLDSWGSGQFRLNCTGRHRDLFQNCGIVGRGLEWIETHCWDSRTGRYHGVCQITFCRSGGLCGGGVLTSAWGDGCLGDG